MNAMIARETASWRRLRRLSWDMKVGILAALVLIVAGGAWLVPPIGEFPGWMAFADHRGFGVVPHFGDVVSNVGFLVVGLWGLGFVLGPDDGRRWSRPAERLPWAVFFLGALLVALASARFHWTPGSATLFWDRLAMAVCFMALTAGVVADRVDLRAGLVALPLLLALGLAGVLHWNVTAVAGQPDLRFYGLVQYFPSVLVVMLVWLFPGRLTDGRYVAGMLGWYALAKVFELSDGAVFAGLGQTVSGHTLKHLAAAVAIYWVLRMLKRAPAIAGGPVGQAEGGQGR